jgi:hypothetical protein
MPALVAVKFSLARFPARRPNGIFIFDIEIPATTIHGYIIVSVPGDTPELCVFIKRISTGRVRYQRKKIFVAQIVYPGPGRGGIGYDIFPVTIIKKSVFHSLVFFRAWKASDWIPRFVLLLILFKY